MILLVIAVFSSGVILGFGVGLGAGSWAAGKDNRRED